MKDRQTLPSRTKILVVDDDRMAADLTVAVLERYGFQARVAYDENAALSTAASFDPQILLLDIQMPRINGFQLAATLRYMLGPATRFVFLTGLAPHQLPHDMPPHDAMLHKPIAPEQLLDALAAVVDLDRRPQLG